MELHIFLLGICFSLQGLMAYYFIRTRHPRSPYREAFGWVNLVCALQLLTDFLLFDYLTDPHFVTIKVAKDLLVLPFGAMEMVCLFFQNTARLSWRKRWRYLMRQEVICVLFLIASLSTHWALLPHLMLLYTLGFSVVVFMLCYKRLRAYELQLQDSAHPRHRSLRWVLLIYVLYLSLCIVYTIVFYVDALPEWLYFLISIAVWMVHASYIARQRPVDVYNLEKTRKRMEQDMRQAMNSLNEQANDLNKRAEKLKAKADMRTYVETFHLQHPAFESQLRALTPNRLTERDLYLCMLISDGKKAPALARNLGIDLKSVEVARSRLRKKLQLQPEQDLYRLITSCL